MRIIPDKTTYIMNMLGPISERSKDLHTQIGCVITTDDYHICTTGYNSFPQGIDDTKPERLERPEKYYWMEHAERNAFYFAAKRGISLDGCYIFQPGYPCMDCARGIISVGIVRVTYSQVAQDAWALTTPKYVPDFERVEAMLGEAGVELISWVK